MLLYSAWMLQLLKKLSLFTPFANSALLRPFFSTLMTCWLPNRRLSYFFLFSYLAHLPNFFLFSYDLAHPPNFFCFRMIWLTYQAFFRMVCITYQTLFCFCMIWLTYQTFFGFHMIWLTYQTFFLFSFDLAHLPNSFLFLHYLAHLPNFICCRMIWLTVGANWVDSKFLSSYIQYKNSLWGIVWQNVSNLV